MLVSIQSYFPVPTTVLGGLNREVVGRIRDKQESRQVSGLEQLGGFFPSMENVLCVAWEYFYCIQLTPAPTKDVPLIAGLALGVGAAMDLVSPPLSTNDFRFGSGSLAAHSQYLREAPALISPT